MSTAEEPKECLACLKQIAPKSQSLQCYECKNSYHVGNCAGVNKTKLKSMEHAELLSWQCSTCTRHNQRQSAQKGGQAAVSPQRTVERNEAAIAIQLAETNQKLTEVLARVENIERKLNLQSVKHDTMIQKLDKQEKTTETIESTTIMLSSQYDELIKKIDSLTHVTNDLKKRTGQIEKLADERDARIQELEWAVEKAEQYSRRNNIEIHGIAQSDQEDISIIVKNIAEKLSLSIPQPEKMESMHRLRAREGKIPPIIVRFNDRSERDQWMTKRTALKNERVYINENLTKLQRWLFWKAKECARERGYTYVWMKNGKILVRQREGAAAIRVDSESDLNRLR